MQSGFEGAPQSLSDVDLFAPGAQEHWYQAYAILHEEAPVQRLPGEGLTPGTDAFVLTKYEDVRRVVMDWDRFPPTLSLLVAHIQQSGEMPTHIPDIDAMIASIVSLRPDPDMWRAHRKELTDPWVGPGCTRHAAMITGHVDDLIAGMLAKARRGEAVDFVADFARPLPQRVMASVPVIVAPGITVLQRILSPRWAHHVATDFDSTRTAPLLAE